VLSSADFAGPRAVGRAASDFPHFARLSDHSLMDIRMTSGNYVSQTGPQYNLVFNRQAFSQSVVNISLFFLCRT
jgi:hypothetical protein